MTDQSTRLSPADLDRLENLEAEATNSHAEYGKGKTFEEYEFIRILRNHAPALITAAREVERMRDDLQAERDGAAILSGYLQTSDAENAKLLARLALADEMSRTIKIFLAARGEIGMDIMQPIEDAVVAYDRSGE